MKTTQYLALFTALTLSTIDSQCLAKPAVAGGSGITPSAPLPTGPAVVKPIGNVNNPSTPSAANPAATANPAPPVPGTAVNAEAAATAPANPANPAIAPATVAPAQPGQVIPATTAAPEVNTGASINGTGTGAPTITGTVNGTGGKVYFVGANGTLYFKNTDGSLREFGHFMNQPNSVEATSPAATVNGTVTPTSTTASTTTGTTPVTVTRTVVGSDGKMFFVGSDNFLYYRAQDGMLHAFGSGTPTAQ